MVCGRDMRRNPINLILTGIAVADLLMMIEYIPFAAHMYLLKYQGSRWISCVTMFSIYFYPGPTRRSILAHGAFSCYSTATSQSIFTQCPFGTHFRCNPFIFNLF